MDRFGALHLGNLGPLDLQAEGAIDFRLTRLRAEVALRCDLLPSPTNRQPFVLAWRVVKSRVG